MKLPRRLAISCGVSILIFAGLLAGQGDDRPVSNSDELKVSHADCDYFGSQRERYVSAAGGAGVRSRGTRVLSDTTQRVSAMLSGGPGAARPNAMGREHEADSIDGYIFSDFSAKGITPAPLTTDWEFIRRVTLDLTGRIPTPERVLMFVMDTAPDKRAKLVEELLAKPEWVDKWTMYFGDLYQNTTTKASTGMTRSPQGRNAFYQWIRDSLASNKPYNKMASELISASTNDSLSDGPSNWILNGFITGGPNQDIMDQSTSFVFGTFLGIAHVNCLLCHNGRGHLDQLSLWASQTTRYQSWQLASYLSHTRLQQARNGNNAVYWTVQDNVTGFTTDYTLNTTTGNRPARLAPNGCKSGQPCYYVPPQYIFTGESPKAGESYRVALARSITNDVQFARATVNYIWAQMFGRGIVDPPDSFDPARLDPDNPPPDPWTLQPSNPRLLNALAKHFMASGYDLKAVMREIANSDTYQLSSSYEGEWNPAWEQYFARKYVRRLWGEEVHDAVAQSSGAYPSYNVTGFTDQGFAKPTFAMQLPDVITGGVDGNTVNLLDSFIRGNRDDQVRKQDGSILQALNLMNNQFVVQRIKASGGAASQLILQNLNRSNTDLINTMFLTILSRYPSNEELSKALATFPASGAARTTAAQDLAWALYNKVDFVFNY